MARGRHGDAQLEDASSRPHRQPRTLDRARTTAILAYRQQRATAWEISARVGVPRSTVARVLRRAGLNRVSRLDPPPVIQRYEWPHAGDLLHLDIKPLSRIRGVGHRIHGDLSVRQRGVGYEYVHVAIDDATRVAYVEVRRSQRRRACAAFLRQRARLVSPPRRPRPASAHRQRRGLSSRAASPASVARGSSATASPGPTRRAPTAKPSGSFKRCCANGPIGMPYLNSAHRTAALVPYLRFYNHRRPHASLGRRSPWTRFQEAA